jgi:hypothetical protein
MYNFPVLKVSPVSIMYTFPILKVTTVSFAFSASQLLINVCRSFYVYQVHVTQECENNAGIVQFHGRNEYSGKWKNQWIYLSKSNWKKWNSAYDCRGFIFQTSFKHYQDSVCSTI